MFCVAISFYLVRHFDAFKVISIRISLQCVVQRVLPCVLKCAFQCVAVGVAVPHLRSKRRLGSLTAAN